MKQARGFSERRLRRRYAAERRFRLTGLLAILAAVAMLGLLLVSIVAKGYSAFLQSELAVEVFYDPEVIDPEDAEMLGDLIVAATNQALAAANEAAQAGVGGIAGGLDLGGLLG